MGVGEGVGVAALPIGLNPLVLKLLENATATDETVNDPFAISRSPWVE